jgi:AraC-like DNA-binding protein
MAGTPPISVARWQGPGAAHLAALPPHAHDFLVLLYVERGDSGAVRIDDRDWSLTTGDVIVLAPWAVVSPHPHGHGADAHIWTVFFPSDAVDPTGPGALVSWRSHPLLFPFARGMAAGGQRLHVPAADRPAWVGCLAELHDELAQRRDNHTDAARALLTLLLVRLSRLDDDLGESLRGRDEPLLGAVFDVIEARYSEPVSLREVAAAVGVSAGHLTTVVGRRTGRTVQQWLTERRLREARRLLVGTDLTVAAIATRVGYRDAGYFVRRFRAAHGTTPAQWRDQR